MNSDDWVQLKALFHTALERTGGDRAAFVARVCDEHPHLEEQLRALVASHSEADDFLEQPAFAGGSLGAGTDADDELQETLGVGHVLDHTYEVEAVLGHGGMGVVYRVRHRALARLFAAKLIHSRVAEDPAFLERFSREAEALGKLKHPDIVDVTDFGVDRDGTARPYLIMEYLEGQTLQERLRKGPLAADDALPVFRAIAAAIDHAHEHGVLHLDLKPGNVLLVDGPDNHSIPKILDFGLAQFLTTGPDERSHAPAVQPIGSPAYMAPELLDGSAPGSSADIYALGVLMYEVLTGRRPFDGSTAEILEQQRHAEPPAASSIDTAIPPEVSAALMALLAKQPTARPATAVAAVALVRDAALAAKQRLWRRAETPRRLGAAVAIAVALTLLSPLLSQLSLFRRLEQQTVDARFALAPRHPPGGDILLLLLDDASLDADATFVPQRAAQFGLELQRVLDAGARAVALDFLLPRAWSSSEPFSQLALRHAERLTLAAYSAPSGEVIGPEAIAGVTTVALGPERASALFGFINLDQDDDGVSRRARLSYRDREGADRPSFAARAVSIGRLAAHASDFAARREGFWIDHTIDAGRFDRMAWKDLDATLSTQPERFRDRLVIVGADYAGSGDEVRVPNLDALPGVVLHALIAETILSNFPVRGLNITAVTLGAGAACGLLCAALLLGLNLRRAVVIVALAGAAYLVGAGLLFYVAKVLLPVIGPILMWGGGGAVAWWIRLRRPVFPRN